MDLIPCTSAQDNINMWGGGNCAEEWSDFDFF